MEETGHHPAGEPPPAENRAPRVRRRFPGLEWVLLLLAAADWLAVRFWAINPPSILALFAAAAVLGFTGRLLWLLWRLCRERRRWLAGIAELLVLGGVLTSLVAGFANWLLGLQGFVILNEGESARLHGGTDLQGFEAGPLAQLEEMHLVLTLTEVELVPVGEGGFFHPRSRLELFRRHGEEAAALTVDPAAAARSGSLRFFQGAFGFAPRIVVTRGEVTVFDRVVPFVSELRGETGICFQGRFTIASEQLEVEGEVDLASLDEGMRGHATLVLAVRRLGVPLGQGSLLPGHYAELDDGYRIGFAGLSKWSEIDVVRRNYGPVVLAGAALALVGAALWALARWRGRRRPGSDPLSHFDLGAQGDNPTRSRSRKRAHQRGYWTTNGNGNEMMDGFCVERSVG